MAHCSSTLAPHCFQLTPQPIPPWHPCNPKTHHLTFCLAKDELRHPLLDSILPAMPTSQSRDILLPLSPYFPPQMLVLMWYISTSLDPYLHLRDTTTSSHAWIVFVAGRKPYHLPTSQLSLSPRHSSVDGSHVLESLHPLSLTADDNSSLNFGVTS